MTRTALLRALACVAAAACCVVGVSSPSYAHRTPVPVPPSPVSQAPELPLLPGHEIKMAASLAPSASDDMGERVNVSELQVELWTKYPSAEITLYPCRSRLCCGSWGRFPTRTCSPASCTHRA